jgi:hypothetical protein
MKAKANFGYVDAEMFKATSPGVRLKFEAPLMYEICSYMQL